MSRGISLAEIKRARKRYSALESRDVFYRVSRHLVDATRAGQSPVSLGEAIAVLLQSWNRQYYRFRPADVKHRRKLDRLLLKHEPAMRQYARRSILSFGPEDHRGISRIFAQFEFLLGPVGAAKALHVLAPGFFPLWDRKIALDHGLRLRRVGENDDRYLAFMSETKQEVRRVDGKIGDPLKAIDELKYCRARDWLSDAKGSPH